MQKESFKAKVPRKYIIGLWLLSIIVVLWKPWLVIAPLSIFAFLFFFFRDPKRTIPEITDSVVLSPADGKVIDIEQVYEGEYLKQNAYKLSIFLSLLDVHINRAPISGKVNFLKYYPGSFKIAKLSSASECNEQNIIGIENSHYRVLVKQIAGMIARRIVCNLQVGSYVKAGEKFGMIKFGSRVETFIPLEAKLLVSVGEKVKAGETILAIITKE